MSGNSTNSPRQTSSPVARNSMKTIFDEPGVYTPGKENNDDLISVKQEIEDIVPSNNRLNAAKQRKRRPSGNEEQSTSFKTAKVSSEDDSPNFFKAWFEGPRTDDCDSDCSSSGTIPLEEDRNKEDVEIIDLTLEVDMGASEGSTEDLPNPPKTIEGNDKNDLPGLIEVANTVEVEFSIQSPLSEEEPSQNEKFTFVSVDVVTENPASKAEDETEETSSEAASIAENISQQSSSAGEKTHDSDSGIENPEEDHGGSLSVASEISENPKEQRTEEEKKESHPQQENESDKGNATTAFVNEIDTEDLYRNIVEARNIPLTVSYEFLNKEEDRLRQAAELNKGAALPIERKRKKLLKEKARAKLNLDTREADLLAKKRLIDDTLDALASNSSETLKLNEEHGKITSSIEEIDLKILEFRVQLAELQADLYRDKIKIQKKLCTDDESAAEKIAKNAKRIDELKNDIEEKERVKEMLSFSAQKLFEKLAVYTDRDTALRRKLDELEILREESQKLVKEYQLKFADVSNELRKTDKRFSMHSLCFMTLEARMHAVKICRKQKALDEKIKTQLSLIRKLTDESQSPELNPTNSN